ETQEDLSDWSLNVADVRKEGLLGAGNFGQVWKVVHVKSNRIFAMKTMKAATMKWAEFEREVRVMMTFRHPNLVKTYAVGSDPEKSFILIDFLTNGSVIDYSNAVRRREKNPLSCTRKYGIASDVLKGMRYLCEENLIHRDLAARNVLLADDFTAKVADFGLALLADTDGTKDGHRDSMGTPWMWTAPEALRGRNRWSSKCDVWSYGVFCWELYTNCERYPYQDEVSNSRELDQFLKSGRRLKVPDSCHIAQLLAQCWTFDPESRPSFQELHSSFRALGPPE
ncbi:Serine-threonine/tyrosine-protein kinase catalytic domain, partial [Trinorchestia longiramus]